MLHKTFSIGIFKTKSPSNGQTQNYSCFTSVQYFRLYLLDKYAEIDLETKMQNKTNYHQLLGLDFSNLTMQYAPFGHDFFRNCAQKYWQNGARTWRGFHRIKSFARSHKSEFGCKFGVLYASRSLRTRNHTTTQE